MEETKTYKSYERYERGFQFGLYVNNAFSIVCRKLKMFRQSIIVINKES